MEVDNFSVWMENASCQMDEMLRAFDEQLFLTDDHKRTLSTIKDIIADQINNWNVQKLRAQVGWPVPPDLDVLQPLCEKISLLLLKQMQQMKQYWEVELSEYFKGMYNEAKRTFAAFIKRCLVIEKQPSSIVVKGTNGKHIEVSLRLLLGKRFFQEISYFPDNVTFFLHL
ncbi:uncharacterized protein LOC110233298 [Exaiptasia diaphana]|uniref:Uncharacterized protein n=1 Tax=Exaiptasia diaphana TaxID=2652724 RepID=A0A913WUC0_EXADI|nr:uncharacterized protein LOC110233298 [Exaiptasia diaphana]